MAGKLDKRVTIALIGTASVCGAGLAYYLYNRHFHSSEESIEIELNLESAQLEWLGTVSDKYTDGDVAIAMKKVVDHCQVASEDPKAAETIFKKVRCNSCGKKEKLPFTVSLLQKQVDFLGDAAKKYEITAGNDKCMRVMLEYAINDAQESSIFGD
ncbi:unnamed protein product [Chondrus crispus]|uniref:Uncharacterized protein n=1 Tax=Chondrus crispus TaxID=2769 RepID=R7QEQ9_CHOCR|nr:unnamed protein product [Chondrus crispus]CDF36273.1 unnamed protein product [Chondrus crispus]|eukprot:XP_005716092.1 unnamed protein product [Chondrus crispus]